MIRESGFGEFIDLPTDLSSEQQRGIPRSIFSPTTWVKALRDQRSSIPQQSTSEASEVLPATNPLAAIFKPGSDLSGTVNETATGPLSEEQVSPDNFFRLAPAALAIGGIFKKGRTARYGRASHPAPHRRPTVQSYQRHPRYPDTPALSRRAFLKAAGALAVTTAVGGAGLGARAILKAHTDNDDLDTRDDSETDQPNSSTWVVVKTTDTPESKQTTERPHTEQTPAPEGQESGWFLPGFEPTPAAVPTASIEQQYYSQDDPVQQNILNPYLININFGEDQTLGSVLTWTSEVFTILRQHIPQCIEDGKYEAFGLTADEINNLVGHLNEFSPEQVGHVIIWCLDTISEYIGYNQATDTPESHFINNPMTQEVPMEISTSLVTLALITGMAPTETMLRRILSLFYYSKNTSFPIVTNQRIRGINLQSEIPFHISMNGFQYSGLDNELARFIYFTDTVTGGMLRIEDPAIAQATHVDDVGPLCPPTAAMVNDFISYALDQTETVEGDIQAPVDSDYDTWSRIIGRAYPEVAQEDRSDIYLQYFAQEGTDPDVHEAALYDLLTRAPDVFVQLLQSHSEILSQILPEMTYLTPDFIRQNWTYFRTQMEHRYQTDPQLKSFIDIASVYYVLNTSRAYGEEMYSPLLALSDTDGYKLFHRQTLLLVADMGGQDNESSISSVQESILQAVNSTLANGKSQFQPVPGQVVIITGISHDPWVNVQLNRGVDSWTSSTTLKMDLTIRMTARVTGKRYELVIPSSDIFYGIRGRSVDDFNTRQIEDIAITQFDEQIAQLGLSGEDLSAAALSFQESLKDLLTEGLKQQGFIPPPHSNRQAPVIPAATPTNQPGSSGQQTSPESHQVATQEHMVDVNELERWYDSVTLIEEITCTDQYGEITVAWYKLDEPGAEEKQHKRVLARYGEGHEHIDTDKPFHFVVHDSGASPSKPLSETHTAGYLRSGTTYSVAFVVGRVHRGDGKRRINIYELGDPTTVEYHTGGANTVSMGVEMEAYNSPDVQQSQLVAVAEIITCLLARYSNLTWVWGHMDQKWANQQDPRVGADNGGKPDPGVQAMKWLAIELQNRGALSLSGQPEDGKVVLPPKYCP